MKFEFKLDDAHLIRYIESAYIPIKEVKIISNIGQRSTTWASVYTGVYQGTEVLIRTWTEADFPSNFIREVMVMRNQESNPYISQLKKVSWHVFTPDLALPQKRYSLIIDLSSAISLYNLYKQDKLPFKERLIIAFDLATALASLHADNITYQKLNSSNVFIMNGRAVLTDFSPRNMAHRVIGEMHDVVAPEILSGSGSFQEPTTDIFSFGVVLADLMLWREWTGMTPWPSDIPSEAIEIITHCRNPKPKYRPTASQLMTKLNKLTLELFPEASLSKCGFLPILCSVLSENSLFIPLLVNLIAQYAHDCKEERFECIVDEESGKRQQQIQEILDNNRVNPKRDEIWKLTLQLLNTITIGLPIPLCSMVLEYYDSLPPASHASTPSPMVSNPRISYKPYDNIEQASQEILMYLISHQLAQFFPEVTKGQTMVQEFLELKSSSPEYSKWIREKMRSRHHCPLNHIQNLAMIVYKLEKTNELKITSISKESDLWSQKKNLTSPHKDNWCLIL